MSLADDKWKVRIRWFNIISTWIALIMMIMLLVHVKGWFNTCNSCIEENYCDATPKFLDLRDISSGNNTLLDYDRVNETISIYYDRKGDFD